MLLEQPTSNMSTYLRRAPKYHKWENYEVLELLADNNGVVRFESMRISRMAINPAFAPRRNADEHAR